MINYILLILLIAVYILSIAAVVTELFMDSTRGFGRLMREIRIRLREFSVSAFVTISIVLIIFGLLVHDVEFFLIFTAIFIMFATLLVLRPGDFIPMYSSRRKAKKKKAVLAKVPLSALDKAYADELPELEELMPLEEKEETEV